MDNPNGSSDYEDFIESMQDLQWTPLHCLVEKENTILVKKLLDEGANIDALDRYKRTALSVASSKGNLSLVKLLLESGAHVNTGFPLHYACEKNNVAITEHLIKSGADINLAKDGTYPLLIAVRNDHLEVTKVLVENGADITVVDEEKESAIHWSCDRGNEELTSFLIKSGCKLDSKDKYDMTPLTICLVRREKQPELVKLLLKNGASVDFVDNTACTYLHIADNPETVIELLKYGLDPNQQNWIKETPLFINSYCNMPENGEILLEFKADPNIRRSGGWTPLHAAAATGSLDLVAKLLGAGADVNAASCFNITPLHLASRNGYIDIVKKLIQVGAFIDVPMIELCDINSNLTSFVEKEWISEEQTSLDLAEKNKHVEVCKLLESSPNKSYLDDVFYLVKTNSVEEVEKMSHECFLKRDLIGWTPLHYSIWQGYCDMSKVLIDKGISVNTLDKYERTPLTLAAAKNNVTLLKLLIENGADVNMGLPLHYAVYNEAVNCIAELIKHGCDINITNKHDYKNPTLLLAAYKSKTASLKTLLDSNADPNCTNKWGETPLQICCRDGNFESVKALIKSGANINAADNFGDTPLIVASYFKKNSDIVNILLENGANINSKGHFQCTPLFNAVESGFETAVLKLLENGAHVNVCDDEDKTPIFSADNPAILKPLISKKADVNYRAPGGWTPLHQFAFDGNLDCVQELLENKAEVNAASAENVLPIYLAALKGHLSVVKELLERGSFIDPYILDFGVNRDDSGCLPLGRKYEIVAGNTPILGACAKGHLDVVKLLQSHGASLESVNSLGNTSLHEAVISESEDIVDFLLGLSVDFDVKNRDLKTPFDLAKKSRNKNVLRLMNVK